MVSASNEYQRLAVYLNRWKLTGIIPLVILGPGFCPAGMHFYIPSDQKVDVYEMDALIY